MNSETETIRQSDSPPFLSRHLGPTQSEQTQMLDRVGYTSLDDLIDTVVPKPIRTDSFTPISAYSSEQDILDHLNQLHDSNQLADCFIGQGYYPTIMPAPIQRNIFENPGWYTAYTPYQAEISQGRLEALVNFQTVITELTGLPLANASLLDEGTAAAEAMGLALRESLRTKKGLKDPVFLVSDGVFPQTVAVLQSRAKPLGIQIIQTGHISTHLSDHVIGVLIQYPDKNGGIQDYAACIEQVHQVGALAIISADLLALTLLKSPGDMGADIVVGSSQRFGVPMGFGGPHAGYFATKTEFQRLVPGRIIGISKDNAGKLAYRMALQTREQHIRRDRATSNICTAQALLAVIAGFYAVYHGPKGLVRIATHVHQLASQFYAGCRALDLPPSHTEFFDTIKVPLRPDQLQKMKSSCAKHNLNVGFAEHALLVAFAEPHTTKDVARILACLSEVTRQNTKDTTLQNHIPSHLKRETPFLEQTVFNRYQSETELLRYMKQLENKDLSLTHAMIPLGSCTMKLNPTTAMIPLSWPKFSQMHPFVPQDQAPGYRTMIQALEEDLCHLTGFKAISFQPNSGAQGEFAGLRVIQAYFESIGQIHRTIVLVPQSAHGTNPASAAMAGLHVVTVRCNDQGSIDIEELAKQIEKHKDNLAGVMITYPSTHGVFEKEVRQVCQMVHDQGGQVYLDGANLNAMVGLVKPADIGADVCHINLHKTFSIPHGGGGPGMGPIGVAEHLVQFLPNHPVVETGGDAGIDAIAAAPWSSASILLISYTYIKLLGLQGLTMASKIAILNANYIKARLQDYYDILFVGDKGLVAHELIIDLKPFKKSHGILVEDVAKRLMDYGFHAPTVAWPVNDSLMIEPTESESKAELDRFCEAMISIYKEIQAASTDQPNPLKMAPHTIEMVTSDQWSYPYSREQAAYPVESLKTHKFWPAIGRIDNAYGDRNLFCSCQS